MKNYVALAQLSAAYDALKTQQAKHLLTRIATAACTDAEGNDLAGPLVVKEDGTVRPELDPLFKHTHPSDRDASRAAISGMPATVLTDEQKTALKQRYGLEANRHVETCGLGAAYDALKAQQAKDHLTRIATAACTDAEGNDLAGAVVVKEDGTVRPELDPLFKRTHPSERDASRAAISGMPATVLTDEQKTALKQGYGLEANRHVSTCGLGAAYDTLKAQRAKDHLTRIATAACTDAEGNDLAGPLVMKEDGTVRPELDPLFKRTSPSDRDASRAAISGMPATVLTDEQKTALKQRYGLEANRHVETCGLGAAYDALKTQQAKDLLTRIATAACTDAEGNDLAGAVVVKEDGTVRPELDPLFKRTHPSERDASRAAISGMPATVLTDEQKTALKQGYGLEANRHVETCGLGAAYDALKTQQAKDLLTRIATAACTDAEGNDLAGPVVVKEDGTVRPELDPLFKHTNPSERDASRAAISGMPATVLTDEQKTALKQGYGLEANRHVETCGLGAAYDALKTQQAKDLLTRIATAACTDAEGNDLAGPLVVKEDGTVRPELDPLFKRTHPSERDASRAAISGMPATVLTDEQKTALKQRYGLEANRHVSTCGLGAAYDTLKAQRAKDHLTRIATAACTDAEGNDLAGPLVVKEDGTVRPELDLLFKHTHPSDRDASRAAISGMPATVLTDEQKTALKQRYGLEANRHVETCGLGAAYDALKAQQAKHHLTRIATAACTDAEGNDLAGPLVVKEDGTVRPELDPLFKHTHPSERDASRAAISGMPATVLTDEQKTAILKSYSLPNRVQGDTRVSGIRSQQKGKAVESGYGVPDVEMVEAPLREGSVDSQGFADEDIQRSVEESREVGREHPGESSGTKRDAGRAGLDIYLHRSNPSSQSGVGSLGLGALGCDSVSSGVEQGLQQQISSCLETLRSKPDEQHEKLIKNQMIGIFSNDDNINPLAQLMEDDKFSSQEKQQMRDIVNNDSAIKTLFDSNTTLANFMNEGERNPQWIQEFDSQPIVRPNLPPPKGLFSGNRLPDPATLGRHARGVLSPPRGGGFGRGGGGASR